jgi:hypothetical protein
MPSAPLVRPLFDGPLDIVGDVHGEIDALHSLMGRLGYDEQGRHRQGRRLVFVGDLADRGPDSPAVVALVRSLIESGRAQCVLGNHEFNAVRQDFSKPELSWLFDESPAFRHRDTVVDQKRATPAQREEILAFFTSLPVALERPDVRVVHAVWDDGMIARVRHETDLLHTYYRHAAWIDDWLAGRDYLDRIDQKLIRQNRNPLKVLTSGPEVRSLAPAEINGKVRNEMRVPWWEWYGGSMLVVFGHYWRGLLPGDDKLHLFAGYDRAEMLGPGNAFCVDLSAGKRFRERLRPGFSDSYVTHLAALRLPERLLYLDNEETPVPVVACLAREATRA